VDVLGGRRDDHLLLVQRLDVLQQPLGAVRRRLVWIVLFWLGRRAWQLWRRRRAARAA